MMVSNTATKAIEAYGGAELWQQSRSIQAEVSVRGLAFTLKRRPFFDHALISMDIHRPYVKLTPIGKDKDVTGVLDGNTVRLEDADGNVLAERINARSYFPYGRRLLYWDDLDMAYFANYAFWNYFTFPRLLMNTSIRWTEKVEDILEAEFPDNIQTHSNIQEFHFDNRSGLLLQHNYTVDIISKLATAAHIIKQHAFPVDGPTYPSSRLVTPMAKSGEAMRMPVLIDIQVHGFRVTDIAIHKE